MNIDFSLEKTFYAFALIEDHASPPKLINIIKSSNSIPSISTPKRPFKFHYSDEHVNSEIIPE